MRIRAKNPQIFLPPHCSSLITLLRYRFFLFAGLLPYVLGASIAYGHGGVFDLSCFLIGLLGLFFALVGVETFNEYFDAREGGDSVFSPGEVIKPRPAIFGLGMGAFALAFGVALFLTCRRGIPVMTFATAGFLAAVFYVGPPLRLSYRGFGEITIALAYGPFMTLGSYYLQTRKLDIHPLLLSVLPLLLLFSLALINEVPDYYGDALVGKRNIVVRMGRRKAVTLYQLSLCLFFIFLAAGSFFNLFPPFLLFALLAVPLAWRNASVARRYYDFPKKFIPAIQGAILLYLSVMCIAIIAHLAD